MNFEKTKSYIKAMIHPAIFIAKHRNNKRIYFVRQVVCVKNNEDDLLTIK